MGRFIAAFKNCSRFSEKCLVYKAIKSSALGSVLKLFSIFLSKITLNIACPL